jgi:hypothetical protein
MTGFLAGRGEKGGLVVLPDDVAMINDMIIVVVQLRYKAGVNLFTPAGDPPPLYRF